MGSLILLRTAPPFPCLGHLVFYYRSVLSFVLLGLWRAGGEGEGEGGRRINQPDAGYHHQQQHELLAPFPSFPFRIPEEGPMG